MRYPFAIVLTLAAACPAIAGDDSVGAGRLRVLYVGNKDTDRGRSYAGFLSEKFDLVGAFDRATFDPGSLPVVDVVVLDWSQSDVQHSRNSAGKASRLESEVKSPLGDRSRWSKPHPDSERTRPNRCCRRWYSPGVA